MCLGGKTGWLLNRQILGGQLSSRTQHFPPYPVRIDGCARRRLMLMPSTRPGKPVCRRRRRGGRAEFASRSVCECERGKKHTFQHLSLFCSCNTQHVDHDDVDHHESVGLIFPPDQHHCFFIQIVSHPVVQRHGHVIARVLTVVCILVW